jgi:hypothetical protein
MKDIMGRRFEGLKALIEHLEWFIVFLIKHGIDVYQVINCIESSESGILYIAFPAVGYIAPCARAPPYRLSHCQKITIFNHCLFQQCLLSPVFPVFRSSILFNHPLDELDAAWRSWYNKKETGLINRIHLATR